MGRTLARVKAFAAGTGAQLREELGSDLDELRQPVDELRRLRGRGPSRMAFDALLQEPTHDTPEAAPAAKV